MLREIKLIKKRKMSQAQNAKSKDAESQANKLQDAESQANKLKDAKLDVKNETKYSDPRIRVSMWIVPGARLIYGPSRANPLFVKDAKTPLSYSEAMHLVMFEEAYMFVNNKPAPKLRADLESVPIALSVSITPQSKISCFTVGQFFNATGWKADGDPIWDERLRKGKGEPALETHNTVCFLD
jgi:hypothetical protein